MKTTTYEVVWQNTADLKRNDANNRWNVCTEEDTLDRAILVRDARKKFFSNEVTVAIREIVTETKMIFD